MGKNNVGRPIKEKTLVKDGKSIMFWLDDMDYQSLLKLENEFRVNRSQLLRMLIRKSGK